MSQHKFTILQAFPWLNKLMLDASGVGEIYQNPVLQPYGSTIKALVDKLQAFESDETLHRMFQPILFAQPSALIEQRLANLTVLGPEKLSKLASLLLDYRFLDIAMFSQLGVSSSPAGQPSHLPIPVLPKMFFKQTSNWPSLVSRGLQLIKECNDDMILSDAPGDSADPTLSILSSLVHRREAIVGHKILSNFECAAAYMSLYLKGIVDLPNKLEDFKSLILKMCLTQDMPSEGWEAFFDSIKTPHAFKLPLHIALSCSPVCLFLPCSIMTKDLSRLVLLQMWQGLGGLRPEELQLIEIILWRALFEAASGLSPLLRRLKVAFEQIEAMGLLDIGFPSSEWLDGDEKFSASRVKRSNAKDTVPTPSSKAGNSRAAESGAADATATTDKLPNTPAAGRTTRSKTVKQEHQTPAHSKAAVGGAKVANPSGEGLKASTHGSNISKKVNAGRVPQNAKGKARAVSPISWTSSDSEDSEVDELMSDDELKPVRKRTISSLSAHSADPSHIVKALKLEDGTRVARVYETIDLTSEAIGLPVIDLTVDDGYEERTPAGMCLLWDWKASIEHLPKFHFCEEADWFRSVFRAIRGCRPGEKPEFLTDKNTSFFSVVDARHATDIPTRDMQERFRQRAIVLFGPVTDCFFDSRSIGNFCMLDKVIRMRDFSIHPDSDRMTTGTLEQLLHSADSDAKSLSAPDIPYPGGAAPLKSLASDVLAWDMTIDQAWCARRWEMPRSAVRWVEISTRDSYRPLGISPNGFATQIEVKTGSHFLIVCQPSPFNPHSMSSIAMLEHFRKPYMGDTKTFAFQAIHLRAGCIAVIKPLTPFLLLSTSHSIVQMSHFYAMSNLQASCIGFLHSSVSMDPSSNPTQKASQSLLRRLVHYFHLVYLNEDYIGSRPNYPHVPDVMAVDGIIDLLSLCNVFEIMNVLSYALSDLDRHLFIEARRLCRRIIAWLQARLTFSDPHGRRLNVTTDLWIPYLTHQLHTLQAYQESLAKENLSTTDANTFRNKLATTIGNNQGLSESFAQSRTRPSEEFGWPPHIVFGISLRLSPGTVPEGIEGTTGDDVAHFGL